ncbi:MAG: cytochrome c biogenesis protein ResB [Actinobacteria bacterium]|nr:cytochrome c biogenesis protein ResB [Actinomycetota bacterium]
MTDSLAPARPAPPPPAKFSTAAWGRWFWRQLTSMRVALILLFALAVASVPGSIFPQRGADPIAVNRYFEQNPALAPWLDRLSMFDVYAAPWFAAIYLLLCISLAGCILPRTIDHVRALRRPPPRPPARLSRMQGYRTGAVEGSEVDVVGAGARWLTSRRWRVRTGDGWVAAEKGYLRETGNLVFHIALLVLLAAVAVGSLLGWRGSVVVIEGRGFSNTLTQYDTFTSGRLVDRAGLAPFTVTLDDFQAEFERGDIQTGAPRDYRAEVSYLATPQSGAETATIGVNSPLNVAGAKVFLTGHGYAPRVIVRDGSGTEVFNGAVPFLPRDGNFTSTGVIKVPDSDPQLGFQGIFLPTAAVDAEAGPISLFPVADDPALFLSAWQGDLGLDDGVPQSVFRLDVAEMTQVGLQSLRPGESWTLPDGLGSIEFVGFDEFANFSVARDPGKELALAAGVAAILGLMASLFIPRRRVWLRTSEDPTGRTLVAVAGLSRTENSSVDDDVQALLEAVASDGSGPSVGNSEGPRA